MQNVLITGAGRPQALGFNLVKRYLEHGDRVFACVRKPTDAFAELLRVSLSADRSRHGYRGHTVRQSRQ